MENLITLDKLNVGQRAIIVKINTQETPIKRRILDMGLTKGTEVVIIKIAPLGDPVQILVRGYSLSIRKEELSKIECLVLQKNKEEERFNGI